MPSHPEAASPRLRLRPTGSQDEFGLVSPRLIIAGYTGRDAAVVAKHIDELAAIGVSPPATVPAFYDLDPGLLTTDPVIEIDGAATSGEVEPVLIRHYGAYYLGVGSDHTDRDLERIDIATSKAACPKPLSPQVTALALDLNALDRVLSWDAITVDSHVDGRKYQHGSLVALRTPADLLVRLTDALGEIGGDLVVFAGTLPLLDGQFRSGTWWQLSLTAAPGIVLTHSYEVKRKSV